MTARNQTLFWALAFLGFLGFVHVFKAILTPFVLGLAVAYLLNPVVHKLGKIKIKRSPAALIILSAFLLFVAAFIAILVPVLYRQTLELAADMPGYVDKLRIMVEPILAQALHAAGLEGSTDLKTVLTDNAATITDVAKRILNGLAAGGSAVLNLMSIAVFMPIVAYFVMKEWDHITAWVEDLLPRDHKNTIKDLLGQIDQKIAGFVRGQISVAFILGLAYAIALTIAGLKYGFLIGLTAGLLSIIPMVGSVLGLIVSIAVAWFQAGELSYVAIIGGIFIVGQLIEGNILSPKIVGDSVGLHPLWIFFALLAGGALFGILGMLIAVPLAATAGVLLAFAITQYKASPLYKGKTKKKAKPKA